MTCPDCTPDKLCHWHERRAKKLKPLKRTPLKSSRKRIKPLSDKRRKQYAVYFSKTKPEFMAENEFCMYPNCNKRAGPPHHAEGKIEELLNDKGNLRALCPKHHTWAEEHPEEAKQLNLSVNRIK